jgi:HAD superfamily hydrolase (TIGR01490 family)
MLLKRFMEAIKKIAIFDFCETLTSFQTADRFVNYVVQDNKSIWVNFLNQIIYILNSFRVFTAINLVFPKWNLSKKICLMKLKGIPEDVIKTKALNYIDEIIYPGINIMILEKLRNFKRNGFLVFISSGGYEPYLTLFSEREGVDKLFCTRIEFIGGKASGAIVGKDCMFENKLTMLKEYLSFEEIVFNDSYVYTDSISDLPLLKWAKNPHVISYNKSQYWSKLNGFNEILLKK